MADGEKATGALARVSTRRRVTIVKPALDAAGLCAGDDVFVRVLGPGRVELTRVDEARPGRDADDGRRVAAIDAVPGLPRA